MVAWGNFFSQTGNIQIEISSPFHDVFSKFQNEGYHLKYARQITTDFTQNPPPLLPISVVARSVNNDIFLLKGLGFGSCDVRGKPDSEVQIKTKVNIYFGKYKTE